MFTFVVPAGGALYLPWWILESTEHLTRPTIWPATPLIAAGVALYLWCLWHFATTGRGTPGPWDPPRRFVAGGPYRYVRNPMYISAALVIGGDAVLFASIPLGVYFVAFAVAVHSFVVLYEEPTLHRLFGDEFDAYRRAVNRWVPRRPRP